MSPVADREGGPVAVVIAGAGARGAYEAGVLSEVLPRLDEEGVRPSLYVGTSAGAINATLFAAHAHRPVKEQVDAALEVWRELTMADVVRPVLQTAPTALGRLLAQMSHLPGAHPTSLLDTAPLRATAQRMGHWDQLRENIDDGTVGLAVVATAADGGRTVVFVDRDGGALPETDQTRAIEYSSVRVDATHVVASAAIPMVFPPVRVEAPPEQAGWFVDGGMRLNAPLKPAIQLGAKRLVVVATHPVANPPELARDAPPPDLDDAMVSFVDVALVDRMVEDVRTLAKVNESPGESRSVVPFLFVGPPRRGTLAAVAARCYDERAGGPASWWQTLRRPDLALFDWLIGGDGLRRGDLLSYIYFDPAFTKAAIELGQNDARRLLGDGPVPWSPPAPSA
ncbi:patatin-like phospholipase family protein [Actinomycetospora sp.]|jgi:NTE family protein|uniref:patatin-like phospholipase family protein n=1 Tax=Actinomycetospora sp. TaxID=1872135 RepID=UPI002F3E3D1B